MLSLYFVSRISPLPLPFCKIFCLLRFIFRIRFCFLLPCACRKENIFIAIAGDIYSSVGCERPCIFGLLFFVSPGAFSLRISDLQMQSGLVEERLLEGVVAWSSIEFCMLKTDYTTAP